MVQFQEAKNRNISQTLKNISQTVYFNTISQTVYNLLNCHLA